MRLKYRVEMIQVRVFTLKLKKKPIRPWSDGTEKRSRLLVKCVNGLMGLPWSDGTEKMSRLLVKCVDGLMGLPWSDEA